MYLPISAAFFSCCSIMGTDLIFVHAIFIVMRQKVLGYGEISHCPSNMGSLVSVTCF